MKAYIKIKELPNANEMLLINDKSYINAVNTNIEYDNCFIFTVNCDDSNYEEFSNNPDCLGMSDADFALRCPTAAKKVFKLKANVSGTEKELSVYEWEQLKKPHVVEGAIAPVIWSGEGI